MGTPQSKTAKSGKPPETGETTQEKIVWSTGDWYEGEAKNYQMHGHGTYHYANGNVYKGQWRHNRRCGYGTLVFAQDKSKYVGHWQDDEYHGEGSIYWNDGSYFKGTFVDGMKHGVGINHDSKGDDYEEEWKFDELVRRSLVSPYKRRSLNMTPNASDGEENVFNGFEAGSDIKVEAEEFSLPLVDSARRTKDSRRNKSGTSTPRSRRTSQSSQPRSEEYQKKYKSEGGEHEESQDEGAQDSQDDEDIEDPDSQGRRNFGQFDSNNFNSENKQFESGEGKFEVGFETLNIIEHMEMLNSAAATLLNKDVNEWNIEDVAEWLEHLSLNDYIDIFKENHVDGKLLFEITETDLKDDFKMTSFGHRKNFMKAVENLKKIYLGSEGKNSEYIRRKIQKFYERNKNKLKMGIFNNSLSSMDKRLARRNFYSRDYYASTNEVIEEAPEHHDDTPPNGGNSSHDGRSHGKRSSQSDEKNSYNGDIEGESEEERKLSDKLTGKSSSRDNLDLKRQGSSSNCGSPSKTNLSKDREPNGRKNSMNHDDFKLDASPAQIKNDPDNTKVDHSPGDPNSTSSSTTSSDESEDEKIKQAVDQTKKSIKPIWDILNRSDKNGEKNGETPTTQPTLEKSTSKNSDQIPKMTKKPSKYHKHNDSFIFRSSEKPSSTKHSKKDNSNSTNQTKKPNKSRRKKRKNTLYQNEQIKEEILKIFKESGLNENFIINFDELTFVEKIGEGGYGRVFLGKFSGIDVAIKEYGRKKLDHKKAEDFVKEIEVISNLRHPNIVLCMGACIHRDKYLMITEYLEEGSLFDHLHKKHTKINDDTLFAIIEDIALGMTYLHGRKVLHCDLKSSNILIDSSWSVKLCDFGLSRTKYKSDKKKLAKQRVGTPHWMAPEILRGEKYQETADVYSFGMILWELITGEIPYYNVPISDIIVNVGQEKKQVPIPTKGPPLIVKIVGDCLNFDPKERPSFKEILSQLQQRNKAGTLSNQKKNGLFSFFGSQSKNQLNQMVQ